MGFSKSHGESVRFSKSHDARDFQNPTAWAIFKSPRRGGGVWFSKSHGVSAIFKIPQHMCVGVAKRPSERFGTQDDKSYRAAQENA